MESPAENMSTHKQAATVFCQPMADKETAAQLILLGGLEDLHNRIQRKPPAFLPGAPWRLEIHSLVLTHLISVSLHAAPPSPPPV